MTTSLRPLFHSCDVVLENVSGGRITILANKNGRAAIELFYPDVPFDWTRQGIEDLPISWRWLCVVPPILSKLNPPDIADLALVFLQARCRVVVPNTNSYQFLHSETDVQKLRPQWRQTV